MSSKSSPSTKPSRPASIPNIQRRPTEPLQAFIKRKQAARARFIKSRRPSKASAVAREKMKAARTPKPTKRRPVRFCDEVVTAIRGQWVAGCRISHIAARHALTENSVRSLIQSWDSRVSCIPTAHQVDMYCVLKPRLPEGPMLAARRAVWLKAINDLTVQMLKPQHNKE